MGIFSITKTLDGDAADDPNVAVSTTYVTNMVVSNKSAAQVVVTLDVPLPVGVASVAYTSSETGAETGATGNTASAAVAIAAEAVTLPVNTEVTYVLTYTLNSDVGTSTSVVYAQVTGEAARRTVAAPTVAVGNPDLKFALEDRDQFQLTQFIHAFFGVGDRGNLQYLLDMTEKQTGGFNFPDMLRDYPPL